MICFNNEFSTFTEKTVFLLFEAGKKKQTLERLEENENEMTFMETTANEIHNHLENIIVAQKHYRLVRNLSIPVDLIQSEILKCFVFFSYHSKNPMIGASAKS